MFMGTLTNFNFTEKPKMFLIQASEIRQLNKQTSPKETAYDGRCYYKIPSHMDFLIVNSVIPGMYAI